MQANPSFWAAQAVCVTGGSGFLGFHLVRQLLALRARVRVFGLRPREDHPLWALPQVEVAIGDVRDRAAVADAVKGCAVIFHTAGVVSTWGPGVAVMHDVHRAGTANVIATSRPDARVVHTSSVVAVGASRRAEVLDEATPFNLADLPVSYVHAKRAAEEIATAAARERDVVIVNPGYLVGPDDHERSVMGRLFQRVWKGRLPLAAPGGLNLVDVRDVALGHLLAAERGERGRRYILGGENVAQRAMIGHLAAVAGYRPRAVPSVPGWLLVGVAHVAERLARRRGKEPYPSLGQARMGRYHWFYRSDRARDELGYAPRPLAETLADTLAWHRGAAELRPRGVNAWWLRAA